MMTGLSKFTLTEDEAAIKLGITKELLFAYTRYSPKTHLGHDRKLSVIRDGQYYKFSSEDLEEWDKYLWEPWSASGKERPSIPAYIDEYLKIECGGCCALCGKGHKLENAHIEDYPLSLSHHHHNLIRLCKDCHSGDTYKIIPKEKIKKLKESLIRKIRESTQEGIISLSRKAVHQTPQVTPLFVGRNEEIANLRNRITKERVIIIDGIGGIGKTQFLIKALEEIIDLHTIWFDVESYESFSDLLLALIPALLKEGIEVRSEESLFNSLNQQPVRIVFDGLDRIPMDKWDQVLDFLENLIELTKEPKIIITTQIELTELTSKIFKLSLPPLSEVESNQLIKSGCENDKNIKLDDEDIDWLISFCDGHPLTIQLVVGQLRYHKNSKIVIKRLRNFGATELKSPTRKHQQRKTSLSVCLETSYSNLNHSQKRLLRYIENFPAGCSAIQIQCFLSGSDYQLDIAELRRFFFVEVDIDWWEIERFSLLNPVKEFIRYNWHLNGCKEAGEIQIEAANNVLMQLIVRATNFINSSDAAMVKDGLARIHYDFPNYLHVLTYIDRGARRKQNKGESSEEYLRIISGIGQGLSRYFFISGMFEQGISITKRTIDALLQLEHYEFAVTQYEYLASYQYRIHDVNGLKETTDKLVALAQRISSPEVNAQASLALGELAQKSGNLIKAIEHYEAAATYYQNALEKQPSIADSNDKTKPSHFYTVRLGMALTAVGTAYNDLKQHKKALTYLLSALDYIEKSNDHPNIGVINHQLGNCYADLGDAEKAIDAYIKALNSFIDLNYKEFISNSMGELGNTISDTTFSAKLDDYFTELLLYAGLEDIEYSVKLLLESNSPLIPEYLAVLRKLFGVIRLIGFTSKADILNYWIEIFNNELLMAFSNNGQDELDEGKRMFLYYSTLIFELGLAVGEISARGKKITKEVIADLCCMCEDFDDYGRDAFQPFEWIAALLRYRGILSNVNAHQLRGAILDAHDMGGHSNFQIQ